MGQYVGGFEWYDPREKLPEVYGYVLGYMGWGIYGILNYYAPGKFVDEFGSQDLKLKSFRWPHLPIAPRFD